MLTEALIGIFGITGYPAAEKRVRDTFNVLRSHFLKAQEQHNTGVPVTLPASLAYLHPRFFNVLGYYNAFVHDRILATLGIEFTVERGVAHAEYIQCMLQFAESSNRGKIKSEAVDVEDEEEKPKKKKKTRSVKEAQDEVSNKGKKRSREKSKKDESSSEDYSSEEERPKKKSRSKKKAKSVSDYDSDLQVKKTTKTKTKKKDDGLELPDGFDANSSAGFEHGVPPGAYAFVPPPLALGEDDVSGGSDSAPGGSGGGGARGSALGGSGGSGGSAPRGVSKVQQNIAAFINSKRAKE